MSDGAQHGLKADVALNAVLGGEVSDDEKPMTAKEMTIWIDEAVPEQTYGGMARWTAKLVLDYLRTHPEASKLGSWALGDQMRIDGVDTYELGITGFMWGWAVNAARRCVELKEIANPAIVTFGDE